MVNFIIVLSVLVLFHELGHYLAARYFGVPVESFAIGFGPRLVGFKRDGTDFKVCALPIGGYVKMAGHSFGGEASDAPTGFGSKPRWQRLVILFAGPAFNFLLAIFVLTGVFMYRYERPTYLTQEPRVDWVRPGSPASEAGVRAGDLVLSVDGAKSATWADLKVNTIVAGGLAVELLVERDGAEVRSTIRVPDGSGSEGDLGWFPAHSVHVEAVSKGMPAVEAGIEPGDRLASIDGVPVVAVEQVPGIVAASRGRPLQIEVERSGDLHEFEVVPRENGDRWQVGISMRGHYDSLHESLAFVPALEMSLRENAMFAGAVVLAIRGLVLGQLEITALEGPVGIYQHTQTAASYGLIVLLEFIAVISVNLGVINLAPVPVLDGGQIVVLLIELLLRRDLSEVVKLRISQAGLVFLVVLFGIVMYNDVARQIFGP